MAEVGSLLGNAENLTNLWRARICKISRQKCRICKFLRQNFVFVNFCNKNVTFSNTQYPKIPDYSENIFGRVRVLLKIIGSGPVSGNRLTLPRMSGPSQGYQTKQKRAIPKIISVRAFNSTQLATSNKSYKGFLFSSSQRSPSSVFPVCHQVTCGRVTFPQIV